MSHLGGYMTSGSYFTYHGVRYGKYTQFLFTKEFFRNIKQHVEPGTHSGTAHYYARGLTTFHSIEEKNGKLIFYFGDPLIYDRIVDFVPDRDIEKIVTPVYYLTPKEMVKHRLKDGTWFGCIWGQTLFYVVCLIISPLFQQWYLIWTVGLYLYLRIAYIELSKGVLYR